MSGSLPQLAYRGPEVKYQLSCGCTVTYITAPPKVREVILCFKCNRAVLITACLGVDGFVMRKVG